MISAEAEVRGQVQVPAVFPAGKNPRNTFNKRKR
jgi:hypothetical protein